MATALLIITRKEGTDRFQEEIGTDKPLGKTSRFFDYMGRMIPNGLYTASMVLHGGITSNSLSWYRALYMTEATLFAGLIANIIKPIVRHKRPGTSQSKMSFPSGHTTVAFAFAGAIMMEHPEPSYVVPAFALASLVGISRMNDNSHHLHDVLAGGTLGLGVAVAMHYFNKAAGFRPEEEHNVSSDFPEDQERKNQKGRWMLGASPTKDLAGGQLSALFVF